MENGGNSSGFEPSLENYSSYTPLNLNFKVENGEERESLFSTSPLNLSPKISSANEKIKKNPNQESTNQNCEKELQISSISQKDSISPPTSWTGLCRTPYLFPSFQFPFLYPLGTAPPTVSSAASPKDTKVDYSHNRSPSAGSPTKPKEFDKSFENRIFTYGSNSSQTRNVASPSQHYQVKWSNHASRLTSFVSSLEGDVASSDTIISLKDGTTFYAHRLVLAAASPFFARTLKNIPKDQQAVVVIPKASSRNVGAILSFCYTGSVGLPSEDMKSVFELAEDLEIAGLVKEKERHNLHPPPPRMTSSPSSVFTFNPPPNFLTENPLGNCSSGIGSSLFGSKIYSTAGPSSAGWKGEKRESPINYSQPLKRIKSESDAFQASIKKSIKSSQSEPSTLLQKRDSPQLPTTLLPFSCYSTPASPCVNSVPESPREDSPTKIIIPRHAGTGSRVLLWRFLLQLLHDRRYSPYYIRWLDRSQGIFRIMESDKVAQLWGLARKNKNMTYEKMSRGMRTYYKRSILFHLDGTKLIYRFNTQEPEIQHQMKYYELMAESAEQNQSPFEINKDYPKSSPSSSGTSSYATTPNIPLSPHFLSNVSHSLYGLGSLFPQQEQ